MRVKPGMMFGGNRLRIKSAMTTVDNPIRGEIIVVKQYNTKLKPRRGDIIIINEFRFKPTMAFVPVILKQRERRHTFD